MGISPFKSSSYCDCETPQTARSNQTLGNPKPHNFEIIKSQQYDRNYLVALIKYPDCTNFEGHKILVMQNMPQARLYTFVRIDPHFCLCDALELIARFRPTPTGWKLACEFAEMLSRKLK